MLTILFQSILFSNAVVALNSMFPKPYPPPTLLVLFELLGTYRAIPRPVGLALEANA